MPLNYLLFDASDDGQGTGSWDAMASVRAPQLPQVQAEVQAVLDWAYNHSPGPRGPLDEGGVWDADLHVQHDQDWVAVTLTLTGPEDWGASLLAHFTPDGG